MNTIALLLALAAPAPRQEAPNAPASAPAQAQTVYGYTRYKEELDQLVREFPGFVRIERLGESRQGRELSLLVASDARGRDAAQKPALLVCAELAAPDGGARAARAMLDSVRQILARASTEPNVGALLSQSTVYFAPALDPDHAFGETRPASAPRDDAPRLCADFPIDWKPEPDRFTPYPLCEPESRAVAALLRARTNLSAVLMFASRARPARASAVSELDPSGAATPVLQPYAATAAAPGSMEAYAEGRLGQRVFLCTPWTLQSSQSEPAADIAAALRSIESLAADLPHLSCDPPTVERLRANLWLVDATIHNTGRLPTALDTALARRIGLDVRLKTAGARVVGIAQQRGGGAFESLPSPGEACRLGHLAGGEAITVRLVVEAQENSSLDLSFEAPRAGESRVLVPLL